MATLNKELPRIQEISRKGSQRRVLKRVVLNKEGIKISNLGEIMVIMVPREELTNIKIIQRGSMKIVNRTKVAIKVTTSKESTTQPHITKMDKIIINKDLLQVIKGAITREAKEANITVQDQN